MLARGQGADAADLQVKTGHGNFARDFAFRDQIRRAFRCRSWQHIAEGFESRTTALLVDLLGRAKGSAGEIGGQLTLLTMPTS